MLSLSTSCKWPQDKLTLPVCRNIEGVKEIYKGSITVTDANKSHEDVSEEIMHRVLKLKHSKGPSRPQRIILMGTPGCGKEKYAQRIADEHELVYI